jgi:hypothetical protein
MPPIVQLISAAWCKRCVTVKPEVAKYCAMAGVTMDVIDFEEMEEAEKATIASLPTIRMKAGPDTEWSTWTTATLEDWKTAIVQTSDLCATDF